MEDNKLDKEKIKEVILEIVSLENRSLSIREITEKLNKTKGIQISQPTVSLYLKELKEEKKIKEIESEPELILTKKNGKKI